MAVCLHAWLAEKFEEQLLLGNNWLQDKNKGAGRARKAAPHAWRGLYHDNGSCLDIINTIPHDRTSALQIVETEPLILTDGSHLILARLDSNCLQHTRSQYPHSAHLPIQAVIAVRKYAIRYTSYGPPRDRLKLILYESDWLGINSSNATLPTAGFLQSVAPVANVLQRLDHTRYLEDRRRLSSGSVIQHEPTLGPNPRGLDVGEREEEVNPTLAPTIETSADMSQNQQPYTQVGFGTQMAPPPARADRPEGGRAMMTGNTSRNNKQSVAPKEEHQRMKLLGLIKRNNSKTYDAPKSPPQDPLGLPMQAGPITPSDKQTPSAHNSPVQRPNSPRSINPEDPTTPVEARSPLVVESPKVPEATAAARDQDDSSNMSIQCSWMKDFVFNSEAMVPESIQRVVLQKPESWFKSQPGVLPFPARNMPHKCFTKLCKIADENAAAQGPTQSEGEEAIDPNEFDKTSSADRGTNIPHHNELPTSQISWSASPTPDPPRRLPTTKFGLPPDSSIGIGESLMVSQGTRTPLPSNVISVKEEEPCAPPSSPPIKKAPPDSDEEMEMETSVPEALGEDTTGATHVAASYVKTAYSEQGLVNPIIQVQETPQAKMKHIRDSSRDRNTESKDTLMLEDNAARDYTSASAKRKFSGSPTKPNSRKSKRREFKIVGFGDDSPPSVDFESALHKDRMESLQRYREERKSSIKSKNQLVGPSTPQASHIKEVIDMDISHTPSNTHNLGAMSPRHQSLYDEPSPPRPLLEAGGFSNASTLPAPSIALPQEHHTSISPCPSEQLMHEDVDSSIVPESTVFEKFRAAYPEYSGNAKHFRGQCKQMYELDQEDKMVPKWQWDDYIIRHKTDYAKYVHMCVEDGEDPEPYHRFYKNNVRDTLYKKSVVDSRNALLTALEELAAEMPAPPLAKVRQRRDDRTSLPNTRYEQKRPVGHQSPHIPQARPRHSLPVGSYINQPSPPSSAPFRRPIHPDSAQSPTRVRSTSNSNLPPLLRSETSHSVPRTRESTGDEFRDFFMAIQRSTSATGSSKVSLRSKPKEKKS